MNKDYKFWLLNSPKKISKKLENYNEIEIKESFGSALEFGTAGIRGEIGWGINKINIYVVANVVYSYGKLLIERYGDEAYKSGIVVIHDNRKMRNEFSRLVGIAVKHLCSWIL